MHQSQLAPFWCAAFPPGSVVVVVVGPGGGIELQAGADPSRASGRIWGCQFIGTATMADDHLALVDRVRSEGGTIPARCSCRSRHSSLYRRSPRAALRSHRSGLRSQGVPRSNPAWGTFRRNVM